MVDTVLLFVFGAFGALIKDIFKDNCLTLPTIQNGICNLGFIGGVLIGAFVGYAVDNDPVTAFLGGYAGYQILESLVTDKPKE